MPTIRRTYNANVLKLLAIAAMTVDHIAWWLFPGYPRQALPLVLHLIGRITCPIMCYFIAEGYHYTRNIRKYTLRLFLFALISHFPYLYASMEFTGWRSFLPFSNGSVLNQTSVLWGLAWGLVMLRVAESPNITKKPLTVLLVLGICVVSFPADWSCIAPLVVLSFGSNRGNPRAQAFWLVFYTALYALVYALALDPVYGLLQMGVVLAIPILRRYNGQRGPNRTVNAFLKWFFYLYYPLHLLVIGLLAHT